jgi:hypothetical protein
MIHHVDQHTIDYMYDEYRPVFILSTGRSGSKFLAQLLGLSANVSAFHEPQPTLQYFSDYAFHHQGEEEILTKIIDAARMESILEVFIKDKIYIESNQCLVFFAPVIARLFSKAKFVHVVRHPGDFVRSAVRKGWHKNDSIWEAGRVKMADSSRWNRLDHIEKLAWLWDTTNRYIDNFFQSLEPERKAFYRIEDLFQRIDSVNALLQFTGAERIAARQISHLQDNRVNEMVIHPNEPPNMKKVKHFPRCDDWDDGMKNKLKTIAANLAADYNYRVK